MVQAATTPSHSVVYEDRCVRIAILDDALIAAWRDPPNHARLAALVKAQRRMLASHPGLLAFHFVLGGETSPLTLPDADRNEMVAVLTTLDGTSSASAIVFEGSAFFVAAWRSIMSVSLLLARPRVPTKVFGDRRRGAEWIRSLSPAWQEAWPTTRLLDAAERVMRGLEAP